MSSKRCSRCEKTVYPIEELKCLDKIWHKQCFKCQECGMTLNMKTYKGFNKLPYCNAHCPQAKHTAVADTPEIRRLAENTRIQSNVKYHEDFEKQRGKVTQVADDPETVRIRNTSKIISNVSYHGELERKKQMEQKRHLTVEKNGVPKEVSKPPQEKSIPGKIANYDPTVGMEAKDSPYSGKLSSTVIFTSKEGPVPESSVRKIGSIADYDPLNDNYGSIGAGYKSTVPSNTLNYFEEGPEHHSQAINQSSSLPRKEGGHIYRAMYDYTAQDSDEVSFVDGDIIVNCYPVDDGWMTGTVERTDQTGMLPANYVELVN